MVVSEQESSKKSVSKKKPSKKVPSKVVGSKISPKKSVDKKSSKKSVSKKKPSRNAIKKDAPEDKLFFLVNGHKLKNIKELADVLSDLEDWVFHHHVSQDKNDFAAWVEHVFEDIELAKKIAGVRSKDKMQLVLYRHLTHRLW